MSVFEQIDRINTAVVNQADLIEQIQNTLAHKAAPAPIEPVIEAKNITVNGTYTVPTGVDGFNPVVVDVPKVIQEKTITSNGTYRTTSGIDGFNPVTVNVPNRYDTCTVNIQFYVSNARLVYATAMTSYSGTDMAPQVLSFDAYGYSTTPNIVCGTTITIVFEEYSGSTLPQFGGGVSDNMEIIYVAPDGGTLGNYFAATVRAPVYAYDTGTITFG